MEFAACTRCGEFFFVLTRAAYEGAIKVLFWQNITIWQNEYGYGRFGPKAFSLSDCDKPTWSPKPPIWGLPSLVKYNQLTELTSNLCTKILSGVATQKMLFCQVSVQEETGEQCGKWRFCRNFHASCTADWQNLRTRIPCAPLPPTLKTNKEKKRKEHFLIHYSPNPPHQLSRN